MNDLFEIETEKAHLSWRTSVSLERKSLPGIGLNSGVLRVENCDSNLYTYVWPQPPDDLPRLYEETNYHIFLKSKIGAPVSIRHSDPTVCAALSIEDSGMVVTGSVNFRSNVGLSRFSVYVEDKLEFDFEIEVFPTKLDYKSDYDLLLAETRWHVAELVFEYLRPTFRTAGPNKQRKSEDISWLYILRNFIESLELAARFVARSPRRDLVTEQRYTAAEKIKRIDSSVRSAVQRGLGSGAFLNLGESVVRQMLPHRTSVFSLDTMEHRWIAFQLQSVRSRLQALIEIEETNSKRWQTEADDSLKESRNSVIVEQLRDLSRRINQLERLEPFDAANSPPPSGFTSLQLMSAPGYKECFQLLTLLRFGLKLESDILQLSVKDISVLYEYWCYLTLVSMISHEARSPIPASRLVQLGPAGVKVNLKKGKQSSVPIYLPDGRTVTVTYNEKFEQDDDAILIPQKPDIMVAIEGAGWPRLSLLLDAKYRVLCDDRILSLYKSPGPAEDAINALHRYRDAILELENSGGDDRPKRTVVQAAAIFPYRDSSGEFSESRLWRGLEKIGIGAIPLVPTEKRYLQMWVSRMLKAGGWSLADKAISHIIVEKREDWRRAASEAVLIGILPSRNAKQRMSWLKESNCYFMPVRKKNPRQFAVKQLAIYEPRAGGGEGAVVLLADVCGTELLKRSEIPTPWEASERRQNTCVLYHLSDLRPLVSPILNVRSEPVTTERWTSRLALERAETLSELLLETEPEWRLYESLLHQGINFDLRAKRIRKLDECEANCRVAFMFDRGIEIVYAGADGFSLTHFGTEFYLPNNEGVVDFLIAKLKEEV